MRKTRNILIYGFAVLIGLAAIYLLLETNRSYNFRGSLIEPPVKAPDFKLIDVNSGDFRLSDLDHQAVIMFFGYTSCPDVCPVTLSDFRQIRYQLDSLADNFSFVFITVDPERDTLEQMRRYLSNFDSEIIGLTGDREALEPVWAAYGVYQAKADGFGEENYLVDHSSRIYVIDPDGNLRLTYLFGTESKVIAQDLRHLISSQ